MPMRKKNGRSPSNSNGRSDTTQSTSPVRATDAGDVSSPGSEHDIKHDDSPGDHKSTGLDHSYTNGVNGTNGTSTKSRANGHKHTHGEVKSLRVAVIGSGVSGLAAASKLVKQGASIVMYEKDSHVGGQAWTEYVQDSRGEIGVDVGFMVCNQVTYPNMLHWFDEHQVEMEQSDMSFSVSIKKGWLEWSSNSLNSVFAQRSNLLNLRFYRMLYDMKRFERDALAFVHEQEERARIGQKLDTTTTMRDFLTARKYSHYFMHYYIVPVCAAVWSCSTTTSLDFPATFILTFMRNHHLLQLTGRPPWLTVKGRTQEGYVRKVAAPFWDCIRLNTAVTQVKLVRSSGKTQVEVSDSAGDKELFDHVVFATHAPDTLKILGSTASDLETEILGAFEYQSNEIYLHQDEHFMPKDKKCWSAWNFLGDDSVHGSVSATYWLNCLQNLGETDHPVLVTLNPLSEIEPSLIVKRVDMSHPVPTTKSYQAQQRIKEIQGLPDRHLWFCGAYLGYGFHEDGCKSGFEVAEQMLCQKSSDILPNPKAFQMSLFQRFVRHQVHSFLRKFVQEGQAHIREIGGGFCSFGKPKTRNAKHKTQEQEDKEEEEEELEASRKRTAVTKELGEFLNPLEITDKRFEEELLRSQYLTKPIPESTTITVKSPSFYTRIFLSADIGLATAYIDGDVTCADWVGFIRILVNNRNIAREKDGRIKYTAKGLLGSLIGRTISYVQYRLRDPRNMKYSRQNIHDHYDLGNSFFALFLDKTMSYSSGIYRNPNDSLYQAQLNKINALITKARICSTDTVLEIGFGWGALSIAAAKKTGCKVIGITLSEEQLKYANELIKKEGLQKQIEYHLVDYRYFEPQKQSKLVRTLPNWRGFDRILSCEMLEAVCHDYYGAFFNCCDRLLAPNGLLVVQVITVPDHMYNEYRYGIDYIRTHIFPGSMCPAFSILTDAMRENSSFVLEDVQNIGPHYARTLEQWRENFHNRRQELLALGFDESFIRKWDYYFVYCEAGFAARTLSDIQAVFTRIGNERL